MTERAHHARPRALAFGAGAAAAALIACSSDGDSGPDPVLPDVDSATFAGDAVTNAFFPLPVGATWVYEAMTDEGLERIEIEVLDPSEVSKTVNGVVATVVEDAVTLDGEVIEYTHDWFAQDTDGNVWYLGEDTCELEPGEFDPESFSFETCANPAGAWEWNVDGALPGVVMSATPAVDGQPYYQEFYPGEAEDAGEVVEVGVSITVKAGSFSGCITIHETSTLDPELDELKTYCPGVGTVLVAEDDESEELVETSL